MRCPDCRRQYSRFTVAPDAFRPSRELVCPHCSAGLRVGWWPIIGIAVLSVVVVAAAAAGFWFGVGDSLVRESGVSHRPTLSKLVGAAAIAAIGVAPIGPGMYAIWVIGWYTRRPTIAG